MAESERQGTDPAYPDAKDRSGDRILGTRPHLAAERGPLDEQVYRAEDDERDNEADHVDRFWAMIDRLKVVKQGRLVATPHQR